MPRRPRIQLDPFKFAYGPFYFQTSVGTLFDCFVEKCGLASLDGLDLFW